MIYAIIFALIAVASAQKTMTLTVSDPEDKKVGESATLSCFFKTTDWSISGLDSVQVHKKQDASDAYTPVSKASNIQAPFTDTGRFSASTFKVDQVDGLYESTLTITVSALEGADNGIYKCVQIRTENNVASELLASTEVTMKVQTKPQSVSLSSALVTALPNVTITEPSTGSNYDLQFNWELGQQVIVNCKAHGGYPDPMIKIFKNDGESLNPSLVPTVSWEGDTLGLKTPMTSTEATVNPYIPVSGDKMITCSSQIQGYDMVKQVAKVVYSGEMGVVCPPKSEAKLDENDFYVQCTVTSSEDLTSVTISFKGFTDIECNRAGRNDFTRAGNGVFCRYEKDANEPDKYTFEMKLSNVDSGKYQQYSLTFDNGAQKATGFANVVKDPKSGEIGGVAMVIPSITLFLISLFLAL